MTDVYKYRVWCNDEQAFIETWGESEPTTCPNNNTHTIDITRTTIIEKILEQAPTDIADKPWVHQSSRPFGTLTYFAGAGDNIHSPGQYGNGELFEHVHTLDSTATIEYIYLDFNMVGNRTFLHEGYIMWEGAQRDTICMEVVSITTPVVPASNTYFNLYGGYLVVPAAGDGVINVPGINLIDGTAAIDCGLVYMPMNELGVRAQAFWNAEWDDTLGMFINIAPAPYGNGQYNMFAGEIPLFRFVNRLPLIKYGFLCMQTSDVEEIGHGMRIRGVMETRGENHEWQFAGWFTMNREKTT